jgi:hypothetical protein
MEVNTFIKFHLIITVSLSIHKKWDNKKRWPLWEHHIYWYMQSFNYKRDLITFSNQIWVIVLNELLYSDLSQQLLFFSSFLEFILLPNSLLYTSSILKLCPFVHFNKTVYIGASYAFLIYTTLLIKKKKKKETDQITLKKLHSYSMHNTSNPNPHNVFVFFFFFFSYHVKCRFHTSTISCKDCTVIESPHTA